MATDIFGNKIPDNPLGALGATYDPLTAIGGVDPRAQPPQPVVGPRADLTPLADITPPSLDRLPGADVRDAPPVAAPISRGRGQPVYNPLGFDIRSGTREGEARRAQAVKDFFAGSPEIQEHNRRVREGIRTLPPEQPTDTIQAPALGATTAGQQTSPLATAPSLLTATEPATPVRPLDKLTSIYNEFASTTGGAREKDAQGKVVKTGNELRDEILAVRGFGDASVTEQNDEWFRFKREARNQKVADRLEDATGQPVVAGFVSGISKALGRTGSNLPVGFERWAKDNPELFDTAQALATAGIGAGSTEDDVNKAASGVLENIARSYATDTLEKSLFDSSSRFGKTDRAPELDRNGREKIPKFTKKDAQLAQSKNALDRLRSGRYEGTGEFAITAKDMQDETRRIKRGSKGVSPLQLKMDSYDKFIEFQQEDFTKKQETVSEAGAILKREEDIRGARARRIETEAKTALRGEFERYAAGASDESLDRVTRLADGLNVKNATGAERLLAARFKTFLK